MTSEVLRAPINVYANWVLMSELCANARSCTHLRTFRGLKDQKIGQSIID